MLSIQGGKPVKFITFLQKENNHDLENVACRIITKAGLEITGNDIQRCRRVFVRKILL